MSALVEKVIDTKVYFYGETKEELRENAESFLDLLSFNQLSNLKAICAIDFIDPNPPLPCYKFRAFCIYPRIIKRRF